MALTLNNTLTNTPQNITSGFVSPTSSNMSIGGTQSTTPSSISYSAPAAAASSNGASPSVYTGGTVTPGNVLGTYPGLVNPVSSPHSSLVSNLATTGGTHTVTDTLGNTSTVKIPAPASAGNSSSSTNNSTSSTPTYNAATGQTTGTFAPGTPQNQGPVAPVDTGTPTFTTPSGATYNSATGQTTAPPTIGNPYTAQVAASAGGNAAIGQNAANIAAQYGQQIAQTGQAGANAEAGNLSTGTSPVAVGNAGLISQNVSAKQSALAAGESAALQGTGQELTAQGQETSGLTSAGGLAQNQVVSPGQAVFNPATGQYTSATSGAGNPTTAPSGIDQTAWDNYVNLAANGQIAAVPSSITGNANLSGQLNAAAEAVNPNYSPITSAAQGNAIGQNVATAGTSDIQIAASGYANILPQYRQATTDFSTADQQAGNLLSTLNQTGINSSNATEYNTTINGLASKLGSTQTTAFTTALTEAQQAYTKLLSSVGAATPTVNGQAATDVLNPSSTPAQIAESIDKLNQAAYAKLAPQYQQALTYYNQLHGTTAIAIPGYPAPTLPTSVGTTPQGPDTSLSTLGQAGIGAVVNTGSAAVGEVSALAKSVLGLF